MPLPAWLDAYLPAPTALSWKQRGLTVGGTLIGIGLTALICGFVQKELGLSLWLMAPLGASAVQVFAVPGSPMSQPWPIIAGHAFSALAGLISLHLFGHTSVGAAVAVGLATALMLQFRCMHPSGGGTALFIIIWQTSNWSFILFPAATNAAVLVIAAIAWHRLTGHTYPQPQRSPRPATLALHRFEPEDLENALKVYNQALSISRAELEALIEQTEIQAYKRMAKDMTCADIMTRDVHSIDASQTAKTAEALMRAQDVRALPVVDSDRRMLGLLTLDSAGEAKGTQTACEAMRADIAHCHPDTPADRLLDQFTQTDCHHVVVVDEQKRLVGMISKSDLMRSLFRAS